MDHKQYLCSTTSKTSAHKMAKGYRERGIPCSVIAEERVGATMTIKWYHVKEGEAPPRCRATVVNYAKATAPFECGRPATREGYCGVHHPKAREEARERTLARNQQLRQAIRGNPEIN